jgi:SAM-dependent methyltransferase
MSGIEPSAGAAAVAAMRGIDVRHGTLSTVTIGPASYDAVVFRHSLEHISDPVEALRTVCSALVPGGLVLITVPNFGSWQARRFGGYWYHLDLPRHRVHFTPGSLERALRAAGLEPVSISMSSSAIGLPASVQYRTFGRSLFSNGLPLRVASGIYSLSLPLAVALDAVAGEADTLHAVARRPSIASSISTSSASAGAG